MESSDCERANMKFCFKLGKSATETHEMLVEVYGDAAVTCKTVYKWFERFRSGSESIDGEERLGRPLTSCTDENILEVNEMIRSNKRLTIREIANDLYISFGSVQQSLTNVLNMKRVSAIRSMHFDPQTKGAAFVNFVGIA
jgi:transposase